MQMPFVISACQSGDVDEVMAIDAKVYPRPWTRQLLLDDLAKPDRHHVVCRMGADPQIVGHASLMSVVDEGHVTTVATDPAWQGRGVARALMLELCRHGVAQGLAAFTLEVRAGHRSAHRLYGDFGFAPVGVRPAYYEPDREDAIIMWAHDVQTPEYVARLESVAERLQQDEGSPRG